MLCCRVCAMHKVVGTHRYLCRIPVLHKMLCCRVCAMHKVMGTPSYLCRSITHRPCRCTDALLDPRHTTMHLLQGCPNPCMITSITPCHLIVLPLRRWLR